MIWRVAISPHRMHATWKIIIKKFFPNYKAIIRDGQRGFLLVAQLATMGSGPTTTRQEKVTGGRKKWKWISGGSPAHCQTISQFLSKSNVFFVTFLLFCFIDSTLEKCKPLKRLRCFITQTQTPYRSHSGANAIETTETYNVMKLTMKSFLASKCQILLFVYYIGMHMY